MKNELLDIYYDVSYYLDKAEENLKNAKNILYEDLNINGIGYKIEDIDNYRQILFGAKDDVDNIIIPSIRNMEE